MKTMTWTKRVGAACSGLLLASTLLLGGGMAAHADEVIPTGSDAKVPATSAADPGEISTRACTSGWKYFSNSRGADAMHQIGPIQSNRNRTTKPASVTFTSTVSGSVSATFSGSVNVSGSVKLASISGQYGVSATASASASIGNSITISVSAGKTGNGKYGIWRLTVKGTEFRTVVGTCQTVDKRATTTVAPFRVGWDTWIS